MKPEEILDAVGEVNEKAVREARASRSPWLKTMAAAVVLVLVVGGVILGISHQEAPAGPQITILASAAEETGPRKFLNYNGCQYVYLENGAEYHLPEGVLGEELGTLAHEIIIGREEHLREDYAATFGVGGTVYALNSYDPDFRIAVELNGSVYLCEKSGIVGDLPMDARDYFETAGFAQTVSSIEICDHNGTEVLKTVRGKKAARLLENLAAMEPADLTGEEYQQIGEAQMAGESFLLSFCLSDGTAYEMYVIPSLSIGMLGNDRYMLPDSFDTEAGSLFDGLHQSPMATH